MNTSPENNNSTPGLKETSMFLMGFTMLMQLRLAIACAKYAVIRFHLPMDKIGLFINKSHNAMELIGLVGITLANIINIPMQKCMLAKAILSVITNWLMYFLSLLTLYVYTYGGEFGDPNLYMWTLIVHHFVFTLNYSFTVGVEPGSVSYTSAGTPLSSVFVTVYHKIFLYFADKYGLDDIDYWLVFGQIVANSVFTYLTACLWTMHCGVHHFTGSQCDNGGGMVSEQSEKKCEDNGSKGAADGQKSQCTLWQVLQEKWTWSPFMLTVFSLSALYCVYPGIAPFQLVDPYTAYNIELLNLFFNPMPALIVCILDHNEIGPSKKWKDNWWWNLSWVAEAYALFCIYICYTILHYPGSFLGKLIIDNAFWVGFLTVSFVTVQEGLKAVGVGGVGVQKGDPNGDVIAFVFIVSLSILSYTGFMGDAYLQIYRKADRDHWPTEGYTRYRGFKFWFNAASKVAKKTILNAFNVDVRREMLK